MTALRLLNNGHPSIVLYDERALTTRKSVFVVVVCNPFLIVTCMVIVPKHCTTFLEKHFNGVGDCHSFTRINAYLGKRISKEDVC